MLLFYCVATTVADTTLRAADCEITLLCTALPAGPAETSTVLHLSVAEDRLSEL